MAGDGMFENWIAAAAQASRKATARPPGGGRARSPRSDRHTAGWHPPAPPGPGDLAAILKRGRRPAALLWLLCVLCMPAIQAAESPDLNQPSGSLLLRMQSGYAVATRLSTDVDMRISGMVARVAVRQQFRNDAAHWTEGVYVFPLPADAAVDRLRLVAGERIIEGEIREKAEARKAYETARREGRRASLVGQQRANLFTTSLANLGPGETVTVEIGYLQTVAYDDGRFSLRFPLTLTPRYVPGRPLPDRQGSGWSPDTDEVPDASLITPPMVTSSRDHRVTLQATIDAGVPLEVIASRYHPVDIEDLGGRYRLAFSRDEVSDHDVELTWRPRRSQAPQALAFAEDSGGDRHLLLMLMPPTADFDGLEMPPREVVFVIDTSGSMQGVSIVQARQALSLALGDLRRGDRFNLVQFNSSTEPLFKASVPADPGNVEIARRWLERLKANGGTEMLPALGFALRRPAQAAEEPGLRQVVFVTDGAVGNEAALYGLIEAELGTARLFTVGIGSAPNGWFMRRAAEAGRGSFTQISALHEVQEKMSLLLARLRQPLLTDIELELPDGLAAEVYPQRIRDLYPGEPVLARVRLALPPRDGAQLVVRGERPGGPWSATLPLAGAADSPGVGALWARARIAALADAERRGAGTDVADFRGEIVATALRYGLVSRHTSLVAVDRTPVRPAGTGLNREQVPNLLPYGQSSRAIFGFPATATVAPLLRVGGSLCLLLATLLLMYRVCTVRGPARATACD